VTLKRSQVRILWSPPIKRPKKNKQKKLKKLSENLSCEIPTTTSQTKLKALAIFALIIGFFILIEKGSFLARFSLDSNASVLTYFIFGIAAGLSTCAALVGGILLSMSKQWNETYAEGSERSRLIPFIMFNSGRLLFFALLGGVLGLIGGFFQISIATTAFMTIFVSFIMLVLGLQLLGVKWARKIQFKIPDSATRHISNEQNFRGKYMPFTVGGLTFFLPCGFTLIAQTNALTLGSFWQSSIAMSAFALGTLPFLAFLSFSSVKFYKSARFATYFNLVTGLLITFFAIYNINSQLNVLGFISLNSVKGLVAGASTTRVTNTTMLSNNQQLMQIEASGFEYLPKYFELKQGIPTRLEVYNSGVYGCAQAMYARGLFTNVVYLRPGINEIEFTPNRKGTYKISCSMGMVDPVTVMVR
jgi:uncharacterized protein